VGGDAALAHLVHLVRTDLDLDALALGPRTRRCAPSDSRWLGRADVILEAAGNHRIGVVDDAQRPVDVVERIDQQPERHDVRQLLEIDVVALHLAPDRIGLLLAPRHAGLDAALGQQRFQLIDR